MHLSEKIHSEQNNIDDPAWSPDSSGKCEPVRSHHNKSSRGRRKHATSRYEKLNVAPHSAIRPVRGVFVSNESQIEGS